MLKLKLPYLGHLMRRADSLGKTLMLGKVKGRRRRGRQRMRWLDGNSDSMDMLLLLSCFSHVLLYATPWTVAPQVSLSFTTSHSSLKLVSIELVMPSTISSSAIPFSSCLQSFPASGSFPMSWLFASGGQSTGA